MKIARPHCLGLATDLHGRQVLYVDGHCVSHDTCLRLKRFCKRHDKQYVMLHSSGLSSLARAIESLAA